MLNLLVQGARLHWPDEFLVKLRNSKFSFKLCTLSEAKSESEPFFLSKGKPFNNTSP
jgi:hypothetical protein